QQVAAVEHLTGVAYQLQQQPQLGRGEVDLAAGAGDLQRAAIDDQFAEGEPIGVGGLQPSEHGPDAGVEHSRLDRLDHVVVGAGFQTDDDVQVVAPGGEQDDRKLVHLAYPAAHLDAVDAGEHHVEDHDFRTPGADVVQRLLAGSVGGHGVPLTGERQLQSCPDGRVIFNK